MLFFRQRKPLMDDSSQALKNPTTLDLIRDPQMDRYDVCTTLQEYIDHQRNQLIG